MDLRKSSYQFHLQLEPPSAFLRREWKTVAVFGGLFSLAMLVAIFAIDPAFFYPRLQTDPLNYYLKGMAFAATGTTSATWAINLKPFAYAAMPGVLRAPLLLAFSDFDDQLRAIQVLNIPIVAAVAVISAYVLSWTQPVRRHWITIAFAFAFTLLSPMWVVNILLPLADAPYALFTLLTVLVAIELICSIRPLATRPGLIAAMVLLFVVSFTLRFTAPVILVFVWTLARGRWPSSAIRPRGTRRIGALTALFVVLLVLVNRQAIFGRYFYEPLAFLRYGDKPGMLLNLLGSAIPSQVIPSFQLGFRHPTLTDTFHATFTSNAQDAAWAAFGIAISFFVILGAWKSRDRFLPEIAYVLAPLPVLALMLPSTMRYLMSYQAFFWIFMYTGMSYAISRVPTVTRVWRSPAIAATMILAGMALSVGLRYSKTAGTASRRLSAIPLTNAPAYVSDVSSTFRSLRSFLETLPAERTLLVGGRGTVGRWKAIAGRDYYSPDSALKRVSAEREVYLLVECGTLEACQDWGFWKREMEKRVTKYGEFTFDSVFAAKSRRSRVEVLRINPST